MAGKIITMNQQQTTKFLLVGIPVFMGIVIFLYFRAYITEKHYEFQGVVQNVSYDIKGTPDIYIDGKKYILSYNDWNFNYKIDKGDSLIKRKNEMVIKLIKHKTGEIIYFK